MTRELAIAAVVRNEEPYLEEWIRYHQTLGVELVVLYDNRSTDRTAEVARDLGAIVVEWPDRYFQQITAFRQALERHGEDARWMAFIDPDEYVFAPGYRSLVDLLDEYLDFDALGVCWACFGTSGHEDPRPSTPRAYLRRSAADLDIGGMEINRHVKSIVQPSRFAPHNPPTPHNFYCRTVDARGDPIDGPYVPEPVWDVVRLNHYISRSEKEAREKMATPNVNTRLLYDFDLCDDRFNAVLDDSMLTHLEKLGLTSQTKERG